MPPSAPNNAMGLAFTQTSSLDWETLHPLDLQRYSHIQDAYQRRWFPAKPALEVPQHDGGHMDYPLLKRLKPWLLCGAPDSAMTEVLTRLFRLKSGANAEVFAVQRKCFVGRKPYWFGRTELSELQLTAKGQQVRPR